MSKTEFLIVEIPFSGFYESWHDQALQDEFDSIFQDDHGWIKPSLEKPRNVLDSLFHWQQARVAYSREYVDSLAVFIGEGIGAKMDSRESREKILAFESLESPREYNFTTDRIFARIPLKLLQAIYKKTPAYVLQHWIKTNFRNTSGFTSFYPNDLKEWDLDSRLLQGQGKHLDHNETGAVLACWLACRVWLGYCVDLLDTESGLSDMFEHMDSYFGWDFMASARENGVISNIIWDSIPKNARKLANAANEIARKEESSL
jgi:hypothetical protein